MITATAWRRATTVLAALALTALPAASPAFADTAATATAAHRALPEPSPVGVARGECDTREVTLARDGQDVVQNEKCQAVSGTWVSPYDDKTFTNAKDLDVDHMVSVPATV
ncbi:hypothetical protein [Kitasatospora sp. NPDC087314]|uniref:hypothetical protein n=1 Tax=Kitasatospora sp. NPDC087314 TaxID=3364068 RepID=UPI0037F38014